MSISMRLRIGGYIIVGDVGDMETSWDIPDKSVSFKTTISPAFGSGYYDDCAFEKNSCEEALIYVLKTGIEEFLLRKYVDHDENKNNLLLYFFTMPQQCECRHQYEHKEGSFQIRLNRNVDDIDKLISDIDKAVDDFICDLEKGDENWLDEYRDKIEKNIKDERSRTNE